MKRLTAILLSLFCLQAAAQQNAQQAARQSTPEAAQQNAPEAARQSISVTAQQNAPKAARQNAPEAARQNAPEAAPETAQQSTPGKAQAGSGWFRYFSDGRAVVRRDSLYGYIDRSGREVIPCRYRKAYTFNDGIAMVRLGHEVFAIDTLGNRLDTRVKIPQFYNRDFENFARWVWLRIPFASTAEYKALMGKSVNVLVTIDEQGRIAACENMQEPDDEAFAKVRDVVMGSPKWTPGQVDGRPVPIRYLLPVDFAKLRQPPCYPVDAQGRRLHKEIVYPLFAGEYAPARFYSWFFRHFRFRNSLEYQQAAPGTVRAAFTIDRKGVLRDVAILSSHNDACMRRTVDLLRRSPRWTPGTADGEPIAVRYEMSFTFRFRE